MGYTTDRLFSDFAVRHSSLLIFILTSDAGSFSVQQYWQSGFRSETMNLGKDCSATGKTSFSRVRLCPEIETLICARELVFYESLWDLRGCLTISFRRGRSSLLSF
jgi:hypothetical protein